MSASDTKSSLTDLLQQLRLEDLRHIASRRGWPIEPVDKAAYATALASLLSNATSVARAVTCLPDELREALRAGFVIEDGHGITAEDLARVITALRGAHGSHIKPVEAAGLLVDLASRGLLLPWDSFPGGTSYLFPWEIQAKVPPLPGWCSGSSLASGRHPSDSNTQELSDLVGKVWQHIALEPPLLRPRAQLELNRQAANLVQDWPIDPREIQKWQQRQGNRTNQTPRSLTVPPSQMLLKDAYVDRLAQLTGVQDEKLEFIVRLLLEMELAKEDDARLVACPEAMDRFAGKTLDQQQRAAAQAYMSMLGWSELDTLLRTDDRWVLTRNPYFSVSYSHFRSELTRARQLVLRFLATAGEKRCCPRAQLEASLLRMWPQFFWLRKSGEGPLLPAALELRRRESTELAQEEQYPPQVAFLRTMLGGPLMWLGYVETYSEDGQPTAVRAHGLRSLIWGSPTAHGTPPTGEPMTFDSQSDTITVLPEAVDPDTPTFLRQIANLESANEHRFVYRLDMRAAHVTFMRGKLLSELELEWQQTMPQPMPDSVTRALHDWWRRYGEVRLYDGFALLEVDDDVTLRELEATTSLARHIVARVSPSLVLVPEAEVDDLMQQIRARGDTPRQVG